MSIINISCIIVVENKRGLIGLLHCVTLGAKSKYKMEHD